jgi:D-sedoheptulose 7-phosphate isomerase
VALEAQLADHVSTLDRTVERAGEAVAEIVERLSRGFRSGSKLFFCGNGGSAADAQHFAAEFVNRFHADRPALPALALTTDTSVLTCIANDACYAQVFARQIEALGERGDILVALSTSGGSANVIHALAEARRRDMVTIALVGYDGGRILKEHLADHVVVVRSQHIPRIQEAQASAYHVLCDLIESPEWPAERR